MVVPVVAEWDLGREEFMKKLYKIIILLFTLFLVPRFVLADTNIDINNPVDVNKDNVVIKNIKFNNLTNTSSKNFGLTGDITNNNNYTVKVEEKVNYYDTSNNLLVTDTVVQIINANDTVKYSEMSNSSMLTSTIKISNFKYYNLSITVTQYNNTQDNTNTPSKTGKYTSEDYVIDSYNIDVVVNSDNSFDITETIDAYFNTARHGIYREIPLKNTVNLVDGKTYSNTAKVTNINVSDAYTRTTEDDNCVLKIGNASSTITGEKRYVISYKYTLSRDNISDYDEFYYNLIGNGWTTYIGNITFKITMPKSFDAAKLGFSSGNYGSTANNVTYSVKDKTITGSYHGILGPSQSLTVRLALDNGYFNRASFHFDFNLKNLLIYVGPMICLILCYLLWYFKGKDKIAVETIEFYPPDNINSLEAAYIYGNKKVTPENITSLLIYLASKGYLEIIEDATDDSKFTIKKVKEYDGNNDFEQKFFDGLFNCKDIPNSIADVFVSLVKNDKKENNNEVTSDDLMYHFYNVVNDIKSDIFYNGIDDTYESGTTFFKVLIAILALATIGFSLWLPVYIQYGELSLATVIIFSLLVYAVVLILINAYTTKDITRILIAIFITVFMMFPAVTTFSSLAGPLVQEYFSENAFALVIGAICTVSELVLMILMPKRTEHGNDLYGKLLGFRRFIETAEADQLKAEVKKNPQYFYNLIPYAYVLGISDVWVKKFESITLVPPTWYYRDGMDFDLTDFNHFMDISVYSNSVLTAAPSSSGSGYDGGGGGFSGGSSGGGFSGGGSGGGGGGSW